MKNILALTILAACLVGGCGSNPESGTADKGTAASTSESANPPVTVAYEIGSKKVGDMGVCVLCNANEGTTAEETVKDTLDYEGKTYVFCNESEKAEFISNPSKYARK